MISEAKAKTESQHLEAKTKAEARVSEAKTACKNLLHPVTAKLQQRRQMDMFCLLW